MSDKPEPRAVLGSGQVSVTATATQIAPENPLRTCLAIINADTVPVYIGNSGVTPTTGAKLLPGQTATITSGAAVYGIVASSTCALSWLEAVDGDIKITASNPALTLSALTGVSLTLSAALVAATGSFSGALAAASAAITGDLTAATFETTGNADVGGTLGVDGAAVFDSTIAAGGAVGEFGATPPVSKPAITGNVTTGVLADLQGVVGLLLTALAAKGTITKSTT